MAVESEVISYIGDFLKIELSGEQIMAQDSLKYLINSSINYIELVVALEKEFGFEFDDGKLDLNTFGSVDNLAQYCSRLIEVNS